MKPNRELASLIGGAAIISTLLAPGTVLAQASAGIQLVAAEGGFELSLPLSEGDSLPQLTSVHRERVLVAEIANVQLPSLVAGDRFRRENPFPGVEAIEVFQESAEEPARIVVTGSTRAPEVTIRNYGNGMLRLGFEFSGRDRALAQANPPAKEGDVLVPNPKIRVNGQPVVENDLAQAPPAPQPPTQPRAIAPPVGDIAVSTIDASPEALELGTLARVPRLVLRDAPVRDVLSLLARSADLNLVYTDPSGDDEAGEGGPTISVDLANESVQEAFNAILQVSGLEASRRGRTVFVGAALPQAARNLITRTYRLNEVTVSAAASFLATQGAATQQVFTPTLLITDPETQLIIRQVEQPSEIISVTVNAEDRAETPLLLNGLSVSTDERLNSITLVGTPRKVEIATNLLQQLDARRRQVAVNVKIVDVNLLNTEDYSASVSFGIGDSFFVSDNGAAALNFGGVNPPTRTDTAQPGFILPTVTPIPLPEGATGEPFFDFQPDAPLGETNFLVPTGTPAGTIPGAVFARPNFGTDDNPFQPGVSDVDEDEIEFTLPGLFQVPSDFLALLQAEIQSGNAKILTDPTLVVQENQTASVNLTSEVFSGVEIDDDTLTPIIREAGLILSVNVTRIDDNGFISLNVVPTISSPGASVETGVAGQGNITLLQQRTLTSGLVRLRDGQTLILTGIIQDSDTTTVSKVPILGDIPLLGALFRSTNRVNQRQEVVVLLTPKILDESPSSGFGFDYTPGRDARELLQQRRFPVQSSPQ